MCTSRTVNPVFKKIWECSPVLLHLQTSGGKLPFLWLFHVNPEVWLNVYKSSGLETQWKLFLKGLEITHFLFYFVKNWIPTQMVSQTPCCCCRDFARKSQLSSPKRHHVPLLEPLVGSLRREWYLDIHSETKMVTINLQRANAIAAYMC